MKTTVRLIEKLHQKGMRNSSDYARINLMIKRYGKDTVEKAIRNIKTTTKSTTHLFNIIEKECQKIINTEIEIDIFKL